AVPRIHLNDAVEVRVPTLNRSFAGKIARFSGRVSTATRTMDTEVDVSNPALVLLPGMYAEVVLTLERRPHALALPTEAISGQETNPTVMLGEAEGKLEIREVKLGLETANRVEVLSGLAAGDLVLTGNRSQLRPGQRVQPKVVG